MSRDVEVMPFRTGTSALSLADLDQVCGGETVPAGNAPATQVVTEGNGSASPDFGGRFTRGWCYWHPYVCRR